MIHVGINTVELQGKFFESDIHQGDHVTQGQTLLTFDIDEISKSYDITTAIIVLNHDHVNTEKVVNQEMGVGQLLCVIPA